MHVIAAKIDARATDNIILFLIVIRFIHIIANIRIFGYSGKFIYITELLFVAHC